MTESFSKRIIERAELAGLADDLNVLELIADSLVICGSVLTARELRQKALFLSSKERQSVRTGEIADLNERLELVEAHLDELNDLLITAGIQDVQSSS